MGITRHSRLSFPRTHSSGAGNEGFPLVHNSRNDNADAVLAGVTAVEVPDLQQAQDAIIGYG